MSQAEVGARWTGRFGWGLVAGWAVLALILDVTWIDLYDRLDFLALLFPVALWCGLAGLAVIVSVRGAHERRWAAFVGLLLTISLLSLAQGAFGGRIGILARFHVLKPKYGAIVEAVEAGNQPPSGTRQIVDNGPPLRVAFPWSGGIGDNWCGVVYDPSGLVMKARNFKPDLSNFSDPTLQDVKQLFGGDLRSCEPLGGSWYYCCFT